MCLHIYLCCFIQANDLPRIVGICLSKGSLAWLPVLFTWKGVVLLAGLFLAFETRKVDHNYR